MNQSLYSQIIKRKSIRKYANELILDEVLLKIQEFNSQVNPLIKEYEYEIRIIKKEDVKIMTNVHPPYYLVLFAHKTDEHYLLNAGFILEQFHLYFSALQIGSCWLGSGKLKKHIKSSNEKLEFVTMIGFGNADEELYRDDVREFKRKEFDEICEIQGHYTFFEALRLAPSSMNSQPWYISNTFQKIVLSRKKINFFQKMLFSKMNLIDMGIALCHLELSFEQYHYSYQLNFEQEFVPNRKLFVASYNIK